MKMNWMLALEWANQKQMHARNALWTQWSLQTLRQWSFQNASMHIKATKPLQWSGAMAIGHDQFDISAIQSHWQMRWPTITLAAKMKARCSRSDEWWKQMNQRVCEWDHSMVPELTSLNCPQHTSSSRKYQGKWCGNDPMVLWSATIIKLQQHVCNNAIKMLQWDDAFKMLHTTVNAMKSDCRREYVRGIMEWCSKMQECCLW
jgi:hypothetical protein